jgi:ABC-type bacteriocin/lantibiotic exporter with double-glycine peptidase domain
VLPQVIVSSCTVGTLLVTAYAVANGDMVLGDFVAVNVRPLTPHICIPELYIWSVQNLACHSIPSVDPVASPLQVYTSNAFQPLAFLGTVYTAVVKALIDMQNLNQLLLEQPDVTDLPNAPPLKPAPPNSGVSVKFDGVCFSYPGQGDGKVRCSQTEKL